MDSIVHNLPRYVRSKIQLESLKQERRTAAIIRAFWGAASVPDKRSGDFLKLLVSLGWINARNNEYSESTTLWRNRLVAEFLDVDDIDPVVLANAIHKRWRRQSTHLWSRLLGLEFHTGITHYYRPLRTRALRHIERHSGEVFRAFSIVAKKENYEVKISAAMRLIHRIPSFIGPIGKHGNVLNAISPTLACLDPDGRFPIMNDRTERLLRGIGEHQDGAGALALTQLIRRIPGIRDNLDLDVYATWQEYEFPARPRQQHNRFISRLVGNKNENTSLVHVAREVRKMRKMHNKLIRQFCEAVRWKYGAPLEGHFDILLADWRKGRDLLIEAKTSASGSSGRFQVRTAIGQLFDYRREIMKHRDADCDLGFLVPKKPPVDVIELFASLRINVFWFESGKLEGTKTL